MAGPCQAGNPGDHVASQLLGYLDCQAQAIGRLGYVGLTAPGASVSLLLGALLTIVIALFGYRMLLGETPTLRSGLPMFLKIAIVLAFATSWPAYRTVVYDVVLKGPASLVGDIGGPAGLPGAGAGLATRIDGVDQGFKALAIAGIGVPANQNDIEPPLWVGSDSFALGAARVVFLATALGGFALLRIAGGLLLALGPLFFLFLLFEGSRGLFIGWLRALFGIMLGSVATAVLLGIEIGLLEPWLSDLLAQRAGNFTIAGVPMPLLGVAMVFLVAMGGLLLLSGWIAGSLNWPVSGQGQAPHRDRSVQPDTPLEFMSFQPAPSVAGVGRSRAVRVADAVDTQDRRMAARDPDFMGSSGQRLSPGHAIGKAEGERVEVRPQAMQRRTQFRVSAGSRRRDLS